MDERELIARCASGRDDAWREFLKTYDPVIRQAAGTTLRSLGGPADDARVEEVRSGVLETLLSHDARALRSFRWGCSFETWLRVIVRTVCVRAARRKKLDPRGRLPAAGAEPPLERLLSEERSRAVQEALRELPERDRTMLSLCFIEGKSYQDISARLGVPMGTVATVLARTRERLRQRLASEGL